jgi:hypothetical protein
MAGLLADKECSGRVSKASMRRRNPVRGKIE